MKLRDRKSYITALSAVIGMAALAATVMAGQPSQREDGALPAALLQERFPVGTCFSTTSYVMAAPTELEAAALSASTGWLRPNAAFIGDLESAAAAFDARVAKAGERIAWMESDRGFERLVRFDLAKGSVWLLTESIANAPCPTDS